MPEFKKKKKKTYRQPLLSATTLETGVYGDYDGVSLDQKQSPKGGFRPGWDSIEHV
jgi:hypothetical protein